ncbi:MAG: hypothetical protein LBT97_12830 [Planctomycetota bacterium]|jgi:hypothetical protein|nr:hypothetical protein [Planctomycetota bacterium]
MPFLDEAVRQAQNAVETKFLFRKLGLPFDFASGPDDFPSRNFAAARETRVGEPNPHGLGAGFSHSCRNHALLFDGYLARIELGIETPSDEMILDRLIGGLIRLATMAPKSFLVGGLAADGRGFYGAADWRNHAAWSFAALRGHQTAAISPESQEKFRSIAGKWLERLKRDQYRVLSVDGKPSPDGDLSADNPLIGPVYLAILLAGALAGGDPEALALYAAAASPGGSARLSPAPEDWSGADDAMLWRQVGLSVVAKHDPDPDRAATAKKRMAESARSALRGIGRWREWDDSLLGVDVDLNWRDRPRAPEAETGGLGFRPHQSWERIARERAIHDALASMLIVLLAGDRELAEAAEPEIGACIGGIPWNGMVWLDAVAPLIAIHARGAELELWDRGLYAARRVEDQAEVSIAAKYLEPAYDRDHPDQAGHRAPPPGKAGRNDPAKPEPGARRKKRKRRKA